MTATLTPPIHSIFGDDSPRVRRSDPVTSHESADLTNVSKSIGWVLDAIARGPLADHELVLLAAGLRMPYTPQRLRTARAALVQAGLVEPSGEFKLTQHNRRAIVWQFNDAKDMQ